MRWGRKRTQELEPDVPGVLPTFWTDRFAGIGARLDESSHNLNEVAVSITGSEIRISALGWDSRVQYNGWLPVYAEMHADQLPSGERSEPKIWERRLLGVGQFLDARQLSIFNPYVLAVGDGLLISAMVKGETSYEGITWHLKGGQ